LSCEKELAESERWVDITEELIKENSECF